MGELPGVRSQQPPGDAQHAGTGAAAFTTGALGVESYRTGKVKFWDKTAKKATDADASWVMVLEQKSKRGRPE